MACPWRVCRPEEGPRYFFHTGTLATAWDAPEGWREEDIPEFDVDDELPEETYEELERRSAEEAAVGGGGAAGDGAQGDAAAAEAAPPAEPAAAAPAPGSTGSGDREGDVGGAAGGSAASPSAAGAARARSSPSAASPPLPPQAGGAAQRRASFRSPSGERGDEAERRSELAAYGWDVPEGGVASTVRLGKTMWKRQTMASSGMEEAEVYYVNTQTGETRWERPDDMPDDDAPPSGDDDEAAGLALHERLQAIDLFAPDTEEQRVAMLAGGTDATFCHKLLERLFGVLETCGDEEEWQAAILEDDLRLPRRVFAFWGPLAPPRVATCVAKILVVMGNLSEEVLLRCIDGTWGASLRSVTGGAMQQLHAVVDHAAARERGDAADDDLSDSPGEAEESVVSTWLLFLRAAYLACGQSLEDLGLEQRELPGTAAVRLLFDVLQCAPESLQPTAVVVITTLHGLHCAYDELSPVLEAAADYPAATAFGAALLAVLNGHGYPYEDEPGLRTTLRMAIDLFSHKPTARILYTNDLNVMVDVVLRELANLPAGDRVRLEYLALLRQLLLRSQWLSVGRYCREDILAALDALLGDERVEAGLDPDVPVYVASMLTEVVAMLE